MTLREQIARKIAEYKHYTWEDLPELSVIRSSMLHEADQILALIKGKYVELAENRPRVICLCGSTRFTSEMLVKQWELTKQGNIVLTWCALPDWYYEGEDKVHIGDQEGVKEIVDQVHFGKIDLSDEVLVINPGGYIGESTSNEIAYAESLGKPVKYLEKDWRKVVIEK